MDFINDHHLTKKMTNYWINEKEYQNKNDLICVVHSAFDLDFIALIEN